MGQAVLPEAAGFFTSAGGAAGAASFGLLLIEHDGAPSFAFGLLLGEQAGADPPLAPQSKLGS